MKVSKESAVSETTFNRGVLVSRRNRANITDHYECVKLRQALNLKCVGILFDKIPHSEQTTARALKIKSAKLECEMMEDDRKSIYTCDIEPILTYDGCVWYERAIKRSGKGFHQLKKV